MSVDALTAGEFRGGKIETQRLNKVVNAQAQFLRQPASNCFISALNQLLAESLDLGRGERHL
jgi:hypothetical protein